jgi:Lsr2
VQTGVDNRAVRAWAESNGFEVSARGRISAEIIQKYRAAGN